MKTEQLHKLLEEVAKQERSVESALEVLRSLPYEELDFAKLDHHRALRTEVSEVVFGPGKTPEQVLTIAERFLASQGRVIITRPTPPTLGRITQAYPQAHYAETARILYIGDFPTPGEQPYVAVVSAGTSDAPVAEEAAVTLELHGLRAVRIYDVGAAGIHRLFDHLEAIWEAAAVVVVAGMEGALATVIGGLARTPVIAVPTSIGYGASFQGLAALLAMLNSCAPGVSVVNIDNGFGAGICAYLIARRTK